MQLPRGTGPLADHIKAVHKAIRESEIADVPVLFWMQPDTQSLTKFEEELSTTMPLSLNTVSTSSGRGREISLRCALTEMGRSKEKRDPFTSTSALPDGIHQSGAGAQLMEGIMQHTAVEVTGGASLLVSEPGVVTPTHFHGPGVLNVYFSLAAQCRRTAALTFRRPEIGGVVGCVKQYVLFVTASLEKAGISLYDLDTTLSLASLISRIERLSQLDGSSVN
jgi:hypothetical protein